MISCQVCWRTTRWHYGRTRRSQNPKPEEVFRDCVTKWDQSAAHSILARSFHSNKGRIHLRRPTRQSHFSLATRRRTIHSGWAVIHQRPRKCAFESIRSFILSPIMADLEQLAESIRKAFPGKKLGSMRLWGESLGRPGEDGVLLIGCEIVNDCLRLKFAARSTSASAMMRQPRTLPEIFFAITQLHSRRTYNPVASPDVSPQVTNRRRV